MNSIRGIQILLVEWLRIFFFLAALYAAFDALMTFGTDDAFDVMLHQELEHGLGHRP